MHETTGNKLRAAAMLLAVGVLCWTDAPRIAHAQSRAPAPDRSTAGPSGRPELVKKAIAESCDGKRKERPGFVVTKDVNGDGVPDYIIDYGKLECDGSTTLFCGSAGCMTDVFASLPNGSFVQAFSDNVRDMHFATVKGRPAMRLALHGSACGRVGSEPCEKVFYWNGAKFGPAR